jgi:hypothetical protein
MRRSFYICGAILALGGSCGTASDVDESVASANGPVPLSYHVNVPVGGGGMHVENATEAYRRGLELLQEKCAAKPSPDQCLGENYITLHPIVGELGTSMQDTIALYGWQATYDRYIAGAKVIRSMLEDEDARALDVYWTINDMQGGTMVTLLNWGREEVQERDELLERAREFPDKVIALGEALYGEEHANLIRKQQAIQAARAIIDQYQRAVAERQAEYETLATDYKAFHAGEIAATDALRDFAMRASEIELPEFPALQQELLAVVIAENRAPQDLILRNARLEGFFESQRQWFVGAIAPHREFLLEEGVPEPDLTSRPLEVLGGMRRYVVDRQQRVNAEAARILDGLRRRKTALLLLQRDAQTRTTIADATRAQAAADFLAEVTAQIQSTWATQPSAGGIELVGGRYEAVLALLQTASLCSDDDASEWMHDGCAMYAVNVSKANVYLQSTLPRKLRRDAAKLRSAGIPTELVATLEAAVDSGDLATAVSIHDSLAHQTEEMP